MKISVIDAFIKPYSIMADNLKNFFKVAGLYVFVLAILGYLLGVSSTCSMSIGEALPKHCSNFGPGFFIYQVIKIFLIASFIKNWGEVVFNKNKINLKPQVQELKIVATIIGFFAVLMLPIASFLILYFRAPNPDWIIESCFFLVVSVGFWLPFLLIRFLPFFGFVATNEQLLSIKETWNLSKENSFRSLLFLILFSIILMIMLTSFGKTFVQGVKSFNFINILFADVFYGFSFLFMLAIFINHCIMLKNLIKGAK